MAEIINLNLDTKENRELLNKHALESFVSSLSLNSSVFFNNVLGFKSTLSNDMNEISTFTKGNLSLDITTFISNLESLKSMFLNPDISDNSLSESVKPRVSNLMKIKDEIDKKLQHINKQKEQDKTYSYISKKTVDEIVKHKESLQSKDMQQLLNDLNKSNFSNTDRERIKDSLLRNTNLVKNTRTDLENTYKLFSLQKEGIDSLTKPKNPINEDGLID